MIHPAYIFIPCLTAALTLAGCAPLSSRQATSATDQPLRLSLMDPGSPARLLRVVADRVLLDFPQPPPFDWGEGVLMAGMMEAGRVLREPRYVAFVHTWADHWRAHGIDRLLAGEGRPLPGYCGQWGPGLALVLLHDATGDMPALDAARRIAAFIERDATRTADGGLGHWRDNRELWVDTLFMACPLLARLSRIDRRPELMHDAVRQLDVFAARTQDPGSGLFHHMYREPKAERIGVLWARGNGWVAMSYVEVLARLDRDAPEAARLRAAFSRLTAGILATQDASSGLWHTVMDRPDSYLETSASAMFARALAGACRLRLLDRREDLRRSVAAAWSGLSGKVDGDGRVYDVSAGTSPADHRLYAAKPRGTFTWGTGAFLLAAAELAAE